MEKKTAREYLKNKLKLTDEQYTTRCELDKDFRLSYIDVERMLDDYTSQYKWISISERKEIKGGWYLVINPNSQPTNEYELAFYRNYNGMFIRDSGDVIHPSYYISLSNLPKPLF